MTKDRNIHEVALAASFMAVGMADADKERTNAAADGVYQAWGQGAVELHSTLVEYAELSEAIWNILEATDPDSAPGVWAYEVCEPFGKWFAERILGGNAPLPEQARNELIAIACKFWAREKPGDFSVMYTLFRHVEIMLAKTEKTAPVEPTKAVVDLETRLTALRDELSPLVLDAREIRRELTEQRTQLANLEQKYRDVGSATHSEIKRLLREAFGQAHDAL